MSASPSCPACYVPELPMEGCKEPIPCGHGCQVTSLDHPCIEPLTLGFSCSELAEEEPGGQWAWNWSLGAPWGPGAAWLAAGGGFGAAGGAAGRRGARLEGVAGRFGVRCRVCGIAPGSGPGGRLQDTDCRRGHLAVSLSFGPNVLDGVIDEEGIDGYAIFAVGSCETMALREIWLREPLVKVPISSVAAWMDDCSCPVHTYTVHLEVDLAGTPLEGEAAQFAIAPITSAGVLPVAATTAPVDDLVCSSPALAGCSGVVCPSGSVPVGGSTWPVCTDPVCSVEDCCASPGSTTRAPSFLAVVAGWAELLVADPVHFAADLGVKRAAAEAVARAAGVAADHVTVALAALRRRLAPPAGGAAAVASTSWRPRGSRRAQQEQGGAAGAGGNVRLDYAVALPAASAAAARAAGEALRSKLAAGSPFAGEAWQVVALSAPVLSVQPADGRNGSSEAPGGGTESSSESGRSSVTTSAAPAAEEVPEKRNLVQILAGLTTVAAVLLACAVGARCWWRAGKPGCLALRHRVSASSYGSGKDRKEPDGKEVDGAAIDVPLDTKEPDGRKVDGAATAVFLEIVPVAADAVGRPDEGKVQRAAKVNGKGKATAGGKASGRAKPGGVAKVATSGKAAAAAEGAAELRRGRELRWKGRRRQQLQEQTLSAVLPVPEQAPGEGSCSEGGLGDASGSSGAGLAREVFAESSSRKAAALPGRRPSAAGAGCRPRAGVPAPRAVGPAPPGCGLAAPHRAAGSGAEGRAAGTAGGEDEDEGEAARGAACGLPSKPQPGGQSGAAWGGGAAAATAATAALAPAAGAGPAAALEALLDALKRAEAIRFEARARLASLSAQSYAAAAAAGAGGAPRAWSPSTAHAAEQPGAIPDFEAYGEASSTVSPSFGQDVDRR